VSPEVFSYPPIVPKRLAIPAFFTLEAINLQAVSIADIKMVKLP